MSVEKPLSPQIRIPTHVKITVRETEQGRIAILADGKLMLDVPAEAAVEIGQVLVKRGLEVRLRIDLARNPKKLPWQ